MRYERKSCASFAPTRLIALGCLVTACASGITTRCWAQAPPGATNGQQQPAAPSPGQARAVYAPPSAPAAGQQPAQPAPPAAPFALTPAEQAFRDQVLADWERESGQIKTFSCRFLRLNYDKVFGPADKPLTKSPGQLYYVRPDRGSIHIEQIYRWDKKQEQHVERPAEIGEHWVCDGKSVFEYRHASKELVETTIPPELRGKAIVDGPLPFLFGAEAEKLKRRYFIRVIDHKDPNNPEKAHLLVTAVPRTQQDAANYRQVDLILRKQDLVPTAMQVVQPNNSSRSVYVFDEPKINGSLDQIWGILSKRPRLPRGWKIVREEATGPPAANAPQRAAQRQPEANPQ